MFLSPAGQGYNTGMASTEAPVAAPRGRRKPKTGGGALAARRARPALSELEFPGCDPLPMSLAEYRRFDERLELWDAETRTAWRVREAPTWEHEGPAQTLAEMAALIAAVRGSPIKCYGAMGLVQGHETGARRRVLHPDQTVYLHPWLVEQEYGDRLLVVGQSFPDVVLEVDHTTDVRAGKLALYESWRIPELWVEVPDRGARSRPAGLVPGLTIHLLKDGAYRVSPESGAFPGWRAADAHEAMNEPVPSARTHALVERLGRRLGVREGTGPDDHPLMRSMRDQSRAEGEMKGRAQGRTEGLAQGRTEGRAKTVRRILESRGIEVSAGFPADAPGFGEAPEGAVVAAALACRSEEDFRARLGARRRAR